MRRVLVAATLIAPRIAAADVSPEPGERGSALWWFSIAAAVAAIAGGMAFALWRWKRGRR